MKADNPQYRAMAHKQGWVCALCGLMPPVGFRLVADVEEGDLKGLLCVGCSGMVTRVRNLGLPRLEFYLGR